MLGVVTARGGSKGLPRKNVRPLAGKPLIAHTIEAAQRAGLVGHLIVSTEDPEIAAVAREYGQGTPYERPPDLARDDTLIYPVLADAIQWVEEHEGFSADYVLMLPPTSPLRTAEDIDNAIQIAFDRDADGVVSVCELRHHPYLAKLVDGDGKLREFFENQVYSTRRQEMPPVHDLNGAIYIARRQLLVEKQTWYTDRTYAYVMPPERSIDIDAEWDLHMAELILEDRARNAAH